MAGADADPAPDSPRFWRHAFHLRQRQGASGGLAAPSFLAEAAPALLAAGKAVLLLRASGLPPRAGCLRQSFGPDGRPIDLYERFAGTAARLTEACTARLLWAGRLSLAHG